MTLCTSRNEFLYPFICFHQLINSCYSFVIIKFANNCVMSTTSMKIKIMIVISTTTGTQCALDCRCSREEVWVAIVVSSLQVIGTMVMTILSAIASSLIVLIFSPIAVAFTLGECGKVLKWYAVVVDDESYCDVEVRNASSPAWRHRCIYRNLVVHSRGVWCVIACVTSQRHLP